VVSRSKRRGGGGGVAYGTNSELLFNLVEWIPPIDHPAESRWVPSSVGIESLQHLFKGGVKLKQPRTASTFDVASGNLIPIWHLRSVSVTCKTPRQMVTSLTPSCKPILSKTVLRLFTSFQNPAGNLVLMNFVRSHSCCGYSSCKACPNDAYLNNTARPPISPTCRCEIWYQSESYEHINVIF